MGQSSERMRLLAELAKRGAYGQGNINLFTRPSTVNPDGSRSTLFSGSSEENGKEVLVPGVGETGQGILPEGQGWQQYKRTGHYLGKYGSVPEADMAANALHLEGASGLTSVPLASSRQSMNPERLRQTLLWLLTKER